MVYFIEPTRDKSGAHLDIRMSILTSDKIMAQLSLRKPWRHNKEWRYSFPHSHGQFHAPTDLSPLFPVPCE